MTQSVHRFKLNTIDVTALAASMGIALPVHIEESFTREVLEPEPYESGFNQTLNSRIACILTALIYTHSQPENRDVHNDPIFPISIRPWITLQGEHDWAYARRLNLVAIKPVHDDQASIVIMTEDVWTNILRRAMD